jgi:DNA-binding response OmpR family regulator
MKTILCVEDELDVLENNRKTLTDNGYSVLAAANLAQARQHLSKTTPDLIVLDIMLPDGNGLEFLQELRGQGCDIPIIMLTAWNRSQNKAQGLDLGANDYMGKPFEYVELLARIRNILKQAEQVPEAISRGKLTLKITSDEAFVNGENMLLTQKEFALLRLFVQYEGRTISAEYLYEKVWGREMLGDDNTIKATISKLRSKLQNSDHAIVSVRGEGYYFGEKG